MSETFWAIRRREMAKHDPIVKKGKAAKVEPVIVEEPVEEPEIIDEPAEEEASE